MIFAFDRVNKMIAWTNRSKMIAWTNRSRCNRDPVFSETERVTKQRFYHEEHEEIINIKRRKRMKTRKCILCLPLALIFFLTLLPMAYGDLYWVSVVKTGGAPKGLPENLPKEVRDQMLVQFKGEADTQKHYLTPYASRTETKQGITIMDFESMTMYQLNPKNKTYTKIDMTSMMKGQMGEIAKKMAEDSKVTRTNETKKIAGYRCRKYIVTIMGAESEYWMSKEVGGYREFEALNEKMLKKHPEFKQMQMGGFTGKEGFPVETVGNMMGMKTTTALEKIEEKSLSKGLFKIPAGYKLVETKMPFK